MCVQLASTSAFFEGRCVPPKKKPYFHRSEHAIVVVEFACPLHVVMVAWKCTANASTPDPDFCDGGSESATPRKTLRSAVDGDPSLRADLSD